MIGGLLKSASSAALFAALGLFAMSGGISPASAADRRPKRRPAHRLIWHCLTTASNEVAHCSPAGYAKFHLPGQFRRITKKIFRSCRIPDRLFVELMEGSM